MIKRLLAVALAMLMLFSSVPTAVFAEMVSDAPSDGGTAIVNAAEAPTGEAPTGEAPTGEAPTGESPTGESPTGEAPTEETPTETDPTEADPTEPDPTEADPTEPDPTEADPTEPDPTEADPTEPDPTEADPTEPDPTEADPTEPDPTEADPTEPDPTEADPTEPDPTEADPTEPDPTEADPTEPDPVAPKYYLAWEYGAITQTAGGHTFTDPAESNLGSYVTVSVDGNPLAEGVLLENVIAEGTTSTVTISAAEGYTIGNVVLASINGTAFVNAPDWTASALGFMSDSSTETKAVIPLADIYAYLLDGDAPNNYLMVELVADSVDDTAGDIDELRPGGPSQGGSYGSNLGWEFATIEAVYSGSSFSGYNLTDSGNPNNVSVTVTIGGTTVAEYNNNTANIVSDVLSSSSTGNVVVNVNTPGWYIAEMILCCGDGNERNPVTPKPFDCNTKSTSDAYTFPVSGSPTHYVASLSSIYAAAKHGSSDDDYFIMVELAPLPAPVYVGYDSGIAGTTAIQARPVDETSNITYTQGSNQYVATPVGSYPTWEYPTAAATHSALGISAAAEAEANALGYSFAGWHMEYYTTYSESGNSFSNYLSVGGTNLYKGANVTLTVHAKLTAIWQPLIKIQVTKVWDDQNDHDGKRPDDVTVHLLRNDVHFGTTVTLNEENGWTGSWVAPKLDENGNSITYYVAEVVPEGYTVNVTTLAADDTYTYRFQATNTHTPETTIVHAYKDWEDADDQDGIRPATVELQLYKTVNGVTSAVAGKTAALSEGNSWAVQWTDMPVYESGHKIVYSVKETSELPAGYSVSYSTDEDTGALKVTNTYAPEVISISGSKIWVDDDNRDGIRPASITVNVLTGGSVVQSVTLPNADGSWTYKFENLAKYRNGGEEIVYTVEEAAVNGYATTYATPVKDSDGNITGYDITNTHTPETVSIATNKVWNDNDDQDGKRPAAITVRLYADGVEVENSAQTVSYQASWSGLIKYINPTGVSGSQREIVYTVSEDPVDGYDTTISGSVADGFTFTNTHTPEVVDLSVTKVWRNDFNNLNGERPYAVVIALYENGQPLVKSDSTGAVIYLDADGEFTTTATNKPVHTVTLTDSNWTGTWTGMAKYIGGQLANYTAVEVGYYQTASSSLVIGTPTDYTVTHNIDAAITAENPHANVINTYSPAVKTLNIQKTWDDQQDQDGKRPQSVTFYLWYTTDQAVANDATKYPPSEENGWKKLMTTAGPQRSVTMTVGNDGTWQDVTVENLPVKINGVDAYYAVTEAAVPNYDTVTYDRVNHSAGIAHVTNSRTPETTSVTVAKSWVDGENQDGIRPASIDVELYKNGVKIDDYTLDESNGWQHTWTGLERYYNGGQAISYTIEEIAVDGYSTSIDKTVNGDGTTSIAITNTHTPETVAISGFKTWNDRGDQDGKRPASITINLLANGVEVAQQTVTSAEDWKWSFTDLPKFAQGTPIAYTITEDAVEGYTTTVNGYNVTNSYTPAVTSVTVNKVWDDSNNQDGMREAATVTLYADSQPVNTVSMNTADGWKHTWNDLPKFRDGGTLIVYTVGESTIEGYSTAITGNAEDGYVITNTHTPETLVVSGSKTWNDANNQDGKRPASITVNLLADGVEVDERNVTAADLWSWSFEDLPKYSNGTLIVYTVTEDAVEYYTAEVNGFNITNTYEPETTEVSVKKVWNDNDDQDGIRPVRVNIILLADGIRVDSAVVTGDAWSHTFSGLQKYRTKTDANAATEEIEYTIEEVSVTGYTTAVTGTAENGYTVTNTHTPELTEVSVTKVWSDSNNQDGKRPASITVNLLADDVKVDSKTVTATDDWSCSFTNLPKNKNGEQIVYTVSEDPVAGYETAITGSAADGYTITNAYTPETTSYTVVKVWNDDTNAAGKRPLTITVHLLANHEHLGEGYKTVMTPLYQNGEDVNQWTYTWTGLPKYENGTEIVYQAEEEWVPEYDEVHAHDAANKVTTITNTYTPDATSIRITKIWDDVHNQDGLRPDEITVHVWADGKQVAGYESITLNAANNWSYEITGLKKYRDKTNPSDPTELILYTITEDAVSDYSTDINGFIITNTHAPETVDISGTKTWMDNDDQDGKRPASITVNLLANGVEVAEQTVSSATDWSWSFTDQPKKKNGTEIVYTVTEDPVEHYTTSITGNAAEGFSITNTHEVEKTQVTVTKEWVDNDNQDGKRPETITYVLYKNGTKVATQTVDKYVNWTHTFTNLDKFEDGNEVTYTVGELEVADYSTSIEGFKITNTHDIEKINVPVEKVWNDADDQDGKRPDSIQVTLYFNGNPVKNDRGEDYTLTLNDASGWKGEFTGVDKYAGGKEIVYTVKEVAIEDYSTVVNTKDGKITVTNSYTPEKTSVSVLKTWEDANDQDGIRPDSITISLYQSVNGGNKTLVKNQTVTEAEGWQTSFTELPVYVNGQKITYSVEETAITGYDSDITGDAVSGFTVTNTHDTVKVEVAGSKIWDDAEDQDGKRPDSITINLMADGVEIAEQTVTSDMNWSWSFTDLSKYKGGEEIVYAVTEDPVADYTSQPDGYNVINIHVPETVSIPVYKVWNDNDDQDAVRPDNITVYLYAGSEKIDAEILTADGRWHHTFNNLPKYEGGEEIVYTVDEAEIDGYTREITGDMVSGYTITNTHDVATRNLYVRKVWDDNDNQDGKRPVAVAITLYRNGEKVSVDAGGDPITNPVWLDSDANWEGQWLNMPEFANGHHISYVVTETAYRTLENGVVVTHEDKTPDGYSVTHAYDTTTDPSKPTATVINSYTPKTTGLNVQKRWEDDHDREGLRPESVTVTLQYRLANDPADQWKTAKNSDGTDRTAVMNKANEWEADFTGLPCYYNAQAVSYRVVEAPLVDDEGNPLVDEKGDPYYTTTYSAPYDASSEQKVGVVTVTNTHVINYVDVSVAKTWNDTDDQDGMRPDSIEVTLYANGYKLSDYSYTDDQGILRSYDATVTLSDEGNWEYQWKHLYEYYKGEKITYTVVEESVPDGYTSSPSSEIDDNGNVKISIVNSHTPEVIDIPVAKVWNDNNDQDGLRPRSITVTLLAGDENVGELTLNPQNGWSGVFTEYPKSEAGAEIVYTVKETAYVRVVRNSDGTIVKNEDGSDKTEAKTGVAGGYSAGYALAKDAAGQTIPNNWIITNTHLPVQTEITAVKIWDDSDNQDGKRPASVTLHLLKNGVHMGEAYKAVLNKDSEKDAQGNWKYTWTGLDKYAAGHKIVYTVYEEPVVIERTEEQQNAVAARAADGYVADYERKSENLVHVTNHYVPETTSVTAIKIWDDGNNRDGIRPASIDVKLVKDYGEGNTPVEVATVTLSEDNSWTYSWNDLPKYENLGTIINYKVLEATVVSGYECAVTEDEYGTNVFILTNTHDPVTTGITISKVWEDENDNDGKRPDGIIVQLYADDAPVEGCRVVLDEERGWNHFWASTSDIPLHVYRTVWNETEQKYDTDKITYEVREIGYVINGVEYDGLPDGYEHSTTGDDSGYIISITNTRATEKISVTVNKIWSDSNNNDGIRPDSVKVTLMKNGTAVETITLDQSNNWSHVWNGLYRYAGGIEAVYTVEETAVVGYTATYAYAKDTNGNIKASVTNSHETATTEFTVRKVWRDYSNIEKVRPSYVTIQVYKNGTAYGEEIILSASNGWAKYIQNVPVYENGAIITWTIQEVNVPKYYRVAYDQESMTVINTLQTNEIPATGDSSNLWTWLFMLGSSSIGLICLLLLGKKNKRRTA